MEDKHEPLQAGSLSAIWYEVCNVIDEVFHAISLDNFGFGVRFCFWSHRYDCYTAEDGKTTKKPVQEVVWIGDHAIPQNELENLGDLCCPDGETSCGQRDGDGFTCTRVKGHPGPHVAHGYENDVCAVWTEGEI